MNFVELSVQFNDSSALRLVRAETAPLILTVLYTAFKREHRPVVAESRLRTILQAELEDLRAAGGFSGKKAAGEYLVEWADDDHAYVRRFHPPDDDEPAYELTPDTERVFQWIESLRPRPYVGTESKFKTLVHILKDLVENTTRSTDVRIERLRAEQARIEQEIEAIRATGVAPVYSGTQINERFLNLLDTARTLLGDFREVERHFRRVTEDLMVSRKSGDTSRGQIVGQTLDAHERLRASTQGQSFYAFWEFLLARDGRAQFSELVDQVYAIPEVLEELREDLLLQALQGHLRAEGSKVLASNERLIAHRLRFGRLQFFFDIFEQAGILRQSEHVVDSLAFTPIHDRVPAKSGISPDQNVHARPPLTNLGHDTLQIRKRFFGRIDAGTSQLSAQQKLATEDVQRQIAIAVVVAVEVPVRCSTSRSISPPASDVISPPSKCATTSRLPNV